MAQINLCIIISTVYAGRTRSETGAEPSSSYIGDGSLPATGSVESLQHLAPPRQPPRPKVDSPAVAGIIKRKRTFINPFDPSKMHTDLTAYHRRWMHTFPRNKEGLAFQVHHAIPEEDVLGNSRSSSFTFTPTKSSLQGSNNSLQLAVETDQSDTKRDNSQLLDDQKRVPTKKTALFLSVMTKTSKVTQELLQLAPCKSVLAAH